MNLTDFIEEYVRNEKDRGFKEVSEKHKKNNGITKLPIRGDSMSAGYDFFLKEDVILEPFEKVVIWSDVKAFMLPDEVLYLHIRSSLAIKKNVVLINSIGVIDASYYGNKSNDGNIGFALENTEPETVVLKAGERVAQGVFHKYLLASDDQTLHSERTGGIGSSDR